MDIKHKLFSNSFWLLGKNFCGYMVRTGTKLFIARWLLPEDFGMIALTISLIDLLALIGSAGIPTFVIYNKQFPEKSLMSTALFFHCALNAILLIGLLSFAPWIEQFFHKEHLSATLRIFGFALLIYPFQNISVSFLERRLQFKKIALAEVISIAVYALLALSLCHQSPSYPSLLTAHYLAIITHTIGVFLFARLRWSLRYTHKRVIYAIIKYGKYVLGQSLLVFTKTQYDNFVVAKFLSAKMLGYYTWAFTIATMPIMMIVHAINSVAFPIYCELQNDRSRTIQVATTIFQALGLVIFPGLMILASFPEAIIGTLFGSQWLGLTPVLKLFCFYSCLRCSLAVFSPLLNSIGRPKILFYVSIVSLLVGLVCIPLGVQYFQMIGAAYAVILVQAIDFVIITRILRKEFPFSSQTVAPIYRMIIWNILLWLSFQALHALAQTTLTQIVWILLSLGAYVIIVIRYEHHLTIHIKSFIKNKLSEAQR